MDQPYNIANFIMNLDESVSKNIAIRTPKESITYAQLRSSVGFFALHMRNRGVNRTSCVAIETKNVFLASVSTLATALLGCRWVQATRNAFSNEAVGITHLLHDGTKGHPDRSNILKLDGEWLDYPGNIDRSAPSQFEGYASPDDTWMIAQSSGTSGTVKFFPISYRVSMARSDVEVSKKGGSYGEYPPIFTSVFHPLVQVCLKNSLTTLMLSGTIISEIGYEYWRKVGVNTVQGSPATLSKLLKHTKAPADSKICRVMINGSRSSSEFINLLFQFFDSVRIGYGSSELDNVCSRVLVDGDLHDGRLGTPRRNAIVQIVDEYDGIVGPSTDGMVRVRSDTQVNGYVGDAKATSEVFRDGWVYPGDIGRLTDDGQLVIMGRVTDVLNLGGGKVDAVIIDEIIQGERGVLDGICFAKPNNLGVDELAAIIALSDGGDDPTSACTGIGMACQTKLGAQSVPRYIYVTDQVPRNERGKATRHLAVEAVKDLEPTWVLPSQ